MENILESLTFLLNDMLQIESPIMSGNMMSGIRIKDIKPDEYTIVIDAPFYDIKKWQKTGSIIPTGENKNGITDYANWVNNYGGFFTHNKSEHWVNRTCFKICDIIANKVGGEVINELEL